MIIRCTHKLLKEMGLLKNDLAHLSTASSTLLGDWYAHLFYILRRKCVIFTNERSLFSFVIFNLRQKDIKNLDEIFRRGLAKTLYEEDFSANNINRLLKEAQDVHYAKTVSKSVLGSMNDLIFQFKSYIFSNGICDEQGIKTATRKINRTPMSFLDGNYPIEKLQELAGQTCQKE